MCACRHFAGALWSLGVAVLSAISIPVRAEDSDSGPQDRALDTIPVAQREAPRSSTAEPRPEPKPIGEIIVTAQRREENAQDVAISMTVFDQEQITNANLTNAGDLATYTPSLSTNERFGKENSTFAIRGFTQDLRTTASVGVYFAEVVAPRGQNVQNSGDGAGPGTFFDLANVQVLKGPQGTLFGRNTTGGAVLIVPNKPTDQFEGYAELSGGDFEARRGQVVINVPVTQTFKLRLGVDSNRREGFLNNVTRIGARDLGNTDYTAVRLSQVLNLTEALENYTILTYVNSKSHGYTSKLFVCNPSLNPQDNPFYALLGPACQQQLAGQKATGNDGYYDLVSTIGTPITDIEEKRLINTTTWGLSEDLTLKNIFAYAHLVTDNGTDIFGTQFRAPYDLNPNHEFKIGFSAVNPDVHVTNQETYVEEFQVQGHSAEHGIRWQGGAYYEHSKPDGFSGNNGAALISCDMSSIEREPSEFDCFDVSAGQLGLVLVGKVKTRYWNQAVYGQTTFDLTERLSLTTGLRYTWDRVEGYSNRTFYGYVGSIQQAPRIQISSPEVDSQAPTGVVELSYKPVEDVMTYAKYIRGYRQGSVNLAVDIGIDTFDPEHVNTYEIGAKTSFGGAFPGRFNVAAFYNDFTNQQLQAGYVSPTSGPSAAVFNAGKSRIYGAEVEAFVGLSQDLTLSLSASFLDTKLLSQEDHRPDVAAAGGVLAGLTYVPIADTGDELPFAPEQTYVAFLNYHVPAAPDVGSIDLGATYVFVGRQRAAATSASPYAMLDSYSLLNLNLNFRSILNSAFDLSLFATNVLDKKYVTYIGGTYNTLGFESRMSGMPRMIGARLRFNF